MKSLVFRFYFDLWNRWDDPAVDEVLSPDFVFRGSLGSETTGRDGWRAYRNAVRAGSPDFHNQIRSVIVEGDRAAARLLYTGTHTGELAGLQASGRQFSYAGAAFFVASEDRLESAWVLGDLAGLTRQLAG